MPSLGSLLLAGLVAEGAIPPTAAMPVRDVVVLYSNGRLLPANIEVDRGLRDALPESASPRTEIYDEFLDRPRFAGEAHDETIAAYLRGKYASHPPDAIVAAGNEALEFVLSRRASVFPGVPVVHVGVGVTYLRSIPAPPDDVVGVSVDYDPVATLEAALRWHPTARRIVLVTGSSAADLEWEQRLRGAAPRFEGRATFEFLSGLPPEDLRRRLAALGTDAVVFTPGFFQDGAGRHYLPRDAARVVAAASGAPVYAPYNTFLGTGIVGGSMPSFEAMGRQAGRTVNEVLDGTPPASFASSGVMPQALNVDWRQVRRWGIDERRIPADAVVHFRTPTFLEEHRWQVVVAAAVFAIQAGLIALLLAERRRRRSSEAARQKQRFELAHASRLAVAGELTASIAHEINQPLGAILSNADTAELLLDSGGDRRDDLRQILADIRRDDLRASEVIRRLRTFLAKHDVERRPFALDEAVRDVASLLQPEARRRRVALDVHPVPDGLALTGDRVQFQQVLMNLALNAMDAAADAAEDRRTVVITVEADAGEVEVQVSDRGQGIAPEHLPRLFDSFFTTKRQGMGLGLAIARTLVEAHGGRIWAEHAPEGGAVFHVRLPAVTVRT
ncbi:MAG TPA: ATP-binding protein [Candidatus Polarisedimenticolaceae bacterium]